MEAKPEIQNSLFNWTNTINELIEALESIQDCEKLRKQLNNVDLNQFKEREIALEFKKSSIDTIDKKLKIIHKKELYYSEKEAESVRQKEELAAMQDILQNGGVDLLDRVKESITAGEDIVLPDFNNDHSKFLSFTSLMVNHSHQPHYKQKDVEILHHSMMAAINGIIEVYSDHIKQLTK